MPVHGTAADTCIRLVGLHWAPGGKVRCIVNSWLIWW
jgi:hypothetical protein